MCLGMEKNKKYKKRSRYIDKESGVGRGIDFHQVSNVINLDFPTSTDMYIHRVGRTARGFNKGTALSFVTDKERPVFELIRTEIERQMGGQQQAVFQPYEIRMNEFEGFQLRARDVLAACTKTVIQEMRLSEIRAEILRSRQLEAYFSQNPRERLALEQDRVQRKLNIHSAGIADVPDYLVPKALRGQKYGTSVSETKWTKGGSENRKRQFFGSNEEGEREDKHGRRDCGKARKWRGFIAKSHGTRRKHLKRMADPLQSFKF